MSRNFQDLLKKAAAKSPKKVPTTKRDFGAAAAMAGLASEANQPKSEKAEISVPSKTSHQGLKQKQAVSSRTANAKEAALAQVVPSPTGDLETKLDEDPNAASEAPEPPKEVPSLHASPSTHFPNLSEISSAAELQDLNNNGITTSPEPEAGAVNNNEITTKSLSNGSNSNISELNNNGITTGDDSNNNGITTESQRNNNVSSRGNQKKPLKKSGLPTSAEQIPVQETVPLTQDSQYQRNNNAITTESQQNNNEITTKGQRKANEITTSNNNEITTEQQREQQRVKTVVNVDGEDSPPLHKITGRTRRLVDYLYEKTLEKGSRLNHEIHVREIIPILEIKSKNNDIKSLRSNVQNVVAEAVKRRCVIRCDSVRGQQGFTILGLSERLCRELNSVRLGQPITTEEQREYQRNASSKEVRDLSFKEEEKPKYLEPAIYDRYQYIDVSPLEPYFSFPSKVLNDVKNQMLPVTAEYLQFFIHNFALYAKAEVKRGRKEPGPGLFMNLLRDALKGMDPFKGVQSEQVKLQNERLKLAEKRKAQMEADRRKLFDAEFAVWELTLSQNDLIQFQTPKSSESPQMALRTYFLENEWPRILSELDEGLRLPSREVEEAEPAQIERPKSPFEIFVESHGPERCEQLIRMRCLEKFGTEAESMLTAILSNPSARQSALLEIFEKASSLDGGVNADL